jgi:hypothetical protein
MHVSKRTSNGVVINNFMYRRPLLRTLYGPVDFLNVLKKGFWGWGGVLLVHKEIHSVSIGDGWEEVLVRNVIHFSTYKYF